MSAVNDFLTSLGVILTENTQSKYALTGASNVYNKDAGYEVYVYSKGGIPVPSLWVVNLFPDGNGDVPQMTSAGGRVQYSFGTASAYDPPNKGPYKCFVTDSAEKQDGPPKVVKVGAMLSDVVDGLGDVNGVHTFWSLQYTERIPVPPPPALPVVKTLDDLRNLAYSIIGISFNPDAALVKYARAHNLGVAVTPEGRFIDDAGVKKAYQAFTNGILFCVEGQWNLIEKVDW